MERSLSIDSEDGEVDRRASRWRFAVELAGGGRPSWSLRRFDRGRRSLTGHRYEGLPALLRRLGVEWWPTEDEVTEEGHPRQRGDELGVHVITVDTQFGAPG